MNVGVGEEETDVDVPKILESTLGKYENNRTITTDIEQYVPVAIEAYGTSHTLRSTPQYGFNHGMKEFDDSR